MTVPLQILKLFLLNFEFVLKFFSKGESPYFYKERTVPLGLAKHRENIRYDSL
jgi:hypothetical protein